MNKKEVLNSFDQLSDQLLTALSEGEVIKKQVQRVLEENARLRLENKRLQELLEQLQPSANQATLPEVSTNHLELIYDEGFHICNDYYGESRETHLECLACLAFLYKDE